MINIRKGIVAGLIVCSLLVTSACTSTGTTNDTDNKDDTTTETGMIISGTVEVWVTDPPPADIQSAVVHLNNIEIHKATANGTDSDNTSGWIMLLESPSSFDLMDVIGIEEMLGSAEVSPGKYTQIRMDVTEVTGNTTDGTPYTAEVPGDKLKIVGNFTVGEGETIVLTLDFDGEKSLISTGKDTFIFKPVVKLDVRNKEQTQEQEQEQEQEEEQGEDAGDEPEKEKEQEQEKGGTSTTLEGTIESIDGTTWTVTIDGESQTVDVSEAEIEGEPAEGLQVTIEGTIEDGTVIAHEIEVMESE